MKYTKTTAIAALILFGSAAHPLSPLGLRAAIRKNKTEPTTASRHFDNDNLPVNDALSVVGPVPDKDAASAPAPAATPAQTHPTARKRPTSYSRRWTSRKAKSML